jgi:flagellar basal body-associated protein FliL
VPLQPDQPDRHHRYPGVKPFTSEEKDLFFGREKDTKDLYSLLFIKQSVVLYGKSGYGKSSLLNAGIIPKLMEEGEWTCFSIRFNNFSEREAKGTVSPMENIKLRLKLDLDPGATGMLDAVIPGEDSFWYWVKALQSADKRSQFIFFFDQFEELFTYPREKIEEFSEQLSQLLYNTVPVRFRKRLAEMDEKGEVSDTLHDYLFEKPEVKVVFSVRSDRLSLLNMLTDRHPTILQNCYELDALNVAQAEQAVVNPARAPQSSVFVTPSFEFTADAVEKILDSIGNKQDGKIETSTLQIVCRYVEDELVGVKGITVISGGLLGNIADIFKQYYEGVLAKLNVNDREKVQHLIEDELIEDGRRNTLTDGYIKKRFGFDDELLRQLEQSSLLRKERDASGRLLYEISHDTLVNAIESVAENRRAIEEGDKRSKLEENLAEERKRAEYLLELNARAVVRTRLAIGLAVISLLVAVFAIFSWHETKLARDVANKLSQVDSAKTVEAMTQEKNAKVALFENNLQKASILSEDVENSYMESHDYRIALRNLRAADSLLQVSVDLPERDKRQRQELSEDIDKQRRTCQDSIK